jgi:hypothetical protein
VAEQLGGAGERVRQILLLICIHFHGLAAGDNRPTPDRQIDGLVQHRALIIEGLETHAVGMLGQLLVAVEAQVTLTFEVDRPAAEEIQASVLADRRDPRWNRLDVDTLRRLALEAKQHRLWRAVARAGRGERTVKIDGDALDPGEHFLRLERLDERTRRAHRADGVRRRRTDANAEEVEDARGHTGHP